MLTIRFGLMSVGQVVTRPFDGGTRSCIQGHLEPFGNLISRLLIVVVLGGRFGGYIRFDQNADQLCCGCFWLWAKCEAADVLQ